MEVSDRPPPSRSDNFRIALCAGLLLTIVASVIAVVIEVESVLGIFPLLVVLGTGLAIAARKLLSWSVFLWAMSAPVMVVVCGMTIATLELSPDKAAVPIGVLLGVYSAVAVPYGWRVLKMLADWRSHEHPARPTSWRFQIKFLMIQTLVLSVLLAIGRAFAGGHTDYFMFATGSAAIIFIGGLVVSIFLAELRSARAIADDVETEPPTSGDGDS